MGEAKNRDEREDRLAALRRQWEADPGSVKLAQVRGWLMDANAECLRMLAGIIGSAS